MDTSSGNTASTSLTDDAYVATFPRPNDKTVKEYLVDWVWWGWHNGTQASVIKGKGPRAVAWARRSCFIFQHHAVSE